VFAALLVLTFNSPQHRARALAGGAVAAVLAAMRACVADASVQRDACHALLLLAPPALAQPQLFCKASRVATCNAAVQAATTALLAHPADAQVQEAGCTLLARLLDGCSNDAAAAAVTPVLAALHCSDFALSNVQVCACNSLSDLLFFPTVRDAASGEDVLQTLVQLLRAAAAPPDLLIAACACLEAASTDAVTAQLAGELGVMGALVCVLMRAQSAQPDNTVMQCALHALLRLMQSSPDNMLRAHHVGAVLVLRTLMRAPGCDEELHQLATRVLTLLQQFAVDAATDAAVGGGVAAGDSAAPPSESGPTAMMMEVCRLFREARDADDAGIAVAALRAHAADANAQRVGFRTLQALLRDDEPATFARATAAGGAEMLVCALETHHSGRTCVEGEACAVLARLTRGDVEAAARAYECGAVDAVVASMRVHARDAQLQAVACMVLGNIFSMHFDNSQSEAEALKCASLRAAAQLAAHAALAALCAHSAAAEVLRNSCFVLHLTLCACDADAVTSAIAPVVAALRVYPEVPSYADDDWEVVFYLLKSIFMRSNTMALRAVSAGALEALLPFLRAGTPPCLTNAACAALSSASFCDGFTARMSALGAVEAVVALLRGHARGGGTCPPVQTLPYQLHLLGCLLRDDAANTQQAHRAGALALVQALLHAHGDAHMVRETAAPVLTRLQQSASDADAAMAALLAEEEAERGAKAGAAAAAKRKKDKKRRGRGGGASAAGGADGASGSAAPLGAADDSTETEAAGDAGGAGAAAAPVDDDDDVMPADAAAAVPAVADAHADVDADAEADAEADVAAADVHGAAAAPAHATHAAVVPPPLHGAGGASDEPAGAGGAAGEAWPPQPLHAAQPVTWPGAAPHAPAPPPPRTQAPREYRPPMGPPPSTCASQAAQPLPLPPPWQLERFAQPPQLSPAQGMLLLPPYLAHLALGGAAPQAQPPLPAPVLPPLPPLPAAPLAAAAPPPAPLLPLPPLPLPPAAALPPPPPPPLLRECCICLNDVPAADLLLLLPCGHRCVCPACADALLSAPPPAPRRCPKCRKDATGSLRVYED
jgi:hypothetical protein